MLDFDFLSSDSVPFDIVVMLSRPWRGLAGADLQPSLTFPECARCRHVVSVKFRTKLTGIPASLGAEFPHDVSGKKCAASVSCRSAMSNSNWLDWTIAGLTP